MASINPYHTFTPYSFPEQSVGKVPVQKPTKEQQTEVLDNSVYGAHQQLAGINAIQGEDTKKRDAIVSSYISRINQKQREFGNKPKKLAKEIAPLYKEIQKSITTGKLGALNKSHADMMAKYQANLALEEPSKGEPKKSILKKDDSARQLDFAIEQWNKQGGTNLDPIAGTEIIRPSNFSSMDIAPYIDKGEMARGIANQIKTQKDEILDLGPLGQMKLDEFNTVFHTQISHHDNTAQIQDTVMRALQNDPQVRARDEWEGAHDTRDYKKQIASIYNNMTGENITKDDVDFTDPVIRDIVNQDPQFQGTAGQMVTDYYGQIVEGQERRGEQVDLNRATEGAIQTLFTNKDNIAAAEGVAGYGQSGQTVKDYRVKDELGLAKAKARAVKTIEDHRAQWSYGVAGLDKHTFSDANTPAKLTKKITELRGALQLADKDFWGYMREMGFTKADTPEGQPEKWIGKDGRDATMEVENHRAILEQAEEQYNNYQDLHRRASEKANANINPEEIEEIRNEAIFRYLEENRMSGLFRAATGWEGGSDAVRNEAEAFADRAVATEHPEFAAALAELTEDETIQFNLTSFTSDQVAKSLSSELNLLFTEGQEEGGSIKASFLHNDEDLTADDYKKYKSLDKEILWGFDYGDQGKLKLFTRPVGDASKRDLGRTVKIDAPIGFIDYMYQAGNVNELRNSYRNQVVSIMEKGEGSIPIKTREGEKLVNFHKEKGTEGTYLVATSDAKVFGNKRIPYNSVETLITELLGVQKAAAAGTYKP